MRYAFIHQKGVTPGEILPHVWEDRTIRLDDLPACIQLVAAALGDHYQVATAKRKMQDIKRNNWEFSQYYAQFQVIPADLDWNTSAIISALRIGLSEGMKHCFTYTNMPEEHPAFMTVFQIRDIQIRS